MFFWEIFFLLFKHFHFDELKSDPVSKKKSLFEQRFKEIREEFKEALEELGENLRPEEEELQRSNLLTPKISEQFKKLVNVNSVFLARMNQLIENFEFSKESEYQEDINILLEELKKINPILTDHLFRESIERMTRFFQTYENDFESEKILDEIKKVGNLAKKESELIQKIALNQIEFERARPGKEEIKENELPEYKKRLEKSNTNEVIKIRKEIILEVHKKRQEKSVNKTIKQVQSQLVQEQQAHQQTKDKLNAIPEDWQQQIKSAQEEKNKAIKEKETYQTQLTQREQKIVQQLNNSLKLGLDKEEKDLNKAIVEIQKLIWKDPSSQTLQEQLQETQQTITQLQNQLNQKPTSSFKENIKEIIEIDEKLLNENQSLKIKLDRQATNYQQLAKERNNLVMQQVKNINIEEICRLIPQAKKEEVQKDIKKAASYANLAERRNQIIDKYVQQNSFELQEIQQQQQKERIFLISLLVISLLTIGGLLIKLKRKKS